MCVPVCVRVRVCVSVVSLHPAHAVPPGLGRGGGQPEPQLQAARGPLPPRGGPQLRPEPLGSQHQAAQHQLRRSTHTLGTRGRQRGGPFVFLTPGSSPQIEILGAMSPTGVGLAEVGSGGPLGDGGAQGPVLQFFTKLRRHASLEGASPYFKIKKWKLDSSQRASSLDTRGRRRRALQRYPKQTSGVRPDPTGPWRKTDSGLVRVLGQPSQMGKQPEPHRVPGGEEPNMEHSNEARPLQRRGLISLHNSDQEATARLEKCAFAR